MDEKEQVINELAMRLAQLEVDNAILKVRIQTMQAENQSDEA